MRFAHSAASGAGLPGNGGTQQALHAEATSIGHPSRIAECFFAAFFSEKSAYSPPVKFQFVYSVLKHEHMPLCVLRKYAAQEKSPDPSKLGPGFLLSGFEQISVLDRQNLGRNEKIRRVGRIIRRCLSAFS